jgi:hypothetical protein
MAVSQIQHFAPSIPAGTPQSSLFVEQMQLGTFQVDWVEIEIPDEVAGTVGFYLASSHTQIIPYQVGTFIVSGGGFRHWDLAGYPTSGDWQFYGYNLGTFDHAIHITFGLELAPSVYGSNVGSGLLPVSALES